MVHWNEWVKLVFTKFHSSNILLFARYAVWILVRDRRQIWFLILSALINFYSPRNHPKTISFLKILGVIEVN